MTERIDKWLYYTRFYRTRALASRAVRGGHVRINGTRSRPSSQVRAGDVIDIVRDQLPWRVEVGALMPRRRGPAREACQCYVEDAQIAERRRAIMDMRRSDRLQMPMTPGKPDKRTRRLIRDRRGRSG